MKVTIAACTTFIEDILERHAGFDYRTHSAINLRRV